MVNRNLDTSVIPHGYYCYEASDVQYDEDGKFPKIIINKCPYWHLDIDRESQNNGYCDYLEIGDWQSDSLSLLWDQVKECGIHTDFD